MSVAFFPDGRRLASGGADRTILIHDLEAGAWIRLLPGHTGNVESLSVSPDGSLLASGSFDAP